ncbi:hypothetical protein CTM44_01435 [Prevotella intermedia]|uniref:hypothetical protein n=1 Tax=Prevotella intermedia TaxID=28131 RepID=UPI000C1C0FA9|nr:hypothetical protein [Prevotella intermedia]ATV32526.1 hypothetical protein CTM44_01435 [Prevotella intermedia]
MYSTREKLIHFNQLVSPQAVEADLALLHEKNPQSTYFVRFDHAPDKNSEDILFALLDVAEHDEIVRNRREFFAAKEAENGTPTSSEGNEPPADGEGNEPPADGEGNEPPTDGEGNEPPADGEGNEPPADGEGNEPPTDGEGNEPPADGEGNEPPTDGEGNEPPADGEENETPADGEKSPVVDNSVDNSSEEGKGNQPKKPATPKKKKKSTKK